MNWSSLLFPSHLFTSLGTGIFHCKDFCPFPLTYYRLASPCSVEEFANYLDKPSLRGISKKYARMDGSFTFSFCMTARNLATIFRFLSVSFRFCHTPDP